jgi:hypothetical protein
MLHRFSAITDALTCAGQGFGQPEASGPGCPGRVPCLMYATFQPFRPHPRPVSNQAFLSLTFSTGLWLWLRVTQSRLGLRSSLAGSPSTGRRIRFVILRTGRSPSVAPHLGISPRQSLRLPGVNFSRKRTSIALIAQLAVARARPSRAQQRPSAAQCREVLRGPLLPGLLRPGTSALRRCQAPPGGRWPDLWHWLLAVVDKSDRHRLVRK